MTDAEILDEVEDVMGHWVYNDLSGLPTLRRYAYDLIRMARAEHTDCKHERCYSEQTMAAIVKERDKAVADLALAIEAIEKCLNAWATDIDDGWERAVLNEALAKIKGDTE